MRHVHAARLPLVLSQGLALALLVPMLSGCLAAKPTVALLISEDSAASAQALDVEVFTARVKAVCDECVVSVYDAEDDAAQQKSQAREAQAEAADVLVVAPVDPTDIESITTGKTPVISVGTPFPGAAHHIGLRDAATGSDKLAPVVPDLEAARDLVLGASDSMTYVPTAEMSEQAADLALSLLTTEDIAGGEDVAGVRSWLYDSQDVTLDSLTSVLVGQGVITLDELCDGTTKARCEKLGFR